MNILKILYWIAIIGTCASGIIFVQGLCLKLPWVKPEEYQKHFGNMMAVSILLLFPACGFLYLAGPSNIMTFLSLYAIGFMIGLLAEIYLGKH